MVFLHGDHRCALPASKVTEVRKNHGKSLNLWDGTTLGRRSLSLVVSTEAGKTMIAGREIEVFTLKRSEILPFSPLLREIQEHVLGERVIIGMVASDVGPIWLLDHQSLEKWSRA